MSSRFRTEAVGLALLLLAGCDKGQEEQGMPAQQPITQGVIDSALAPGSSAPAVTEDPRAAAYYDNADAVNTGKRLFHQYNCSGCHSNGGGGMGPSLMDDEWIYGGRLTQIHQTLVEGRPNGMPAWGGRIPDEQLWQISAYVRSMSLPATLAAQNGPTPSQSPAPVPRAADQHAGWAPPPDTTNDYTTTTMGPG
ncbi:MAG TPA: c-type cytochrome [Sphingomonadaceae bacterium]|jgi:cytochrome c oxidase cbb3-type subunit 3|nr:c-type cytochrome [Sphingomonadaceae bacterium]